MRKFEIIALSVGSKSNRIYNSGEVINEDGFVAENIDKLIEEGFIKESFEDVKEDKPKGNDKPKK